VLNRRTFLSLIGSIAAAPFGFAQQTSRKVALYANVGAELIHYDADVAGAALVRCETITLPASVQYAWPHASNRYLYVATSTSARGYGAHGTAHYLTALRIDAASGALSRHGESIRLPTRPIHLTTDIPSKNILVAFNNPSALRVYRINSDFTPGDEVTQPGAIDAGVYAHQVRVTPDNRLAILVTRGTEGRKRWLNTEGALKVFEYRNGVLANCVSIAPRGEHFGPRHLDFHPTRPWLYVSLETQNKIYTYKMEGGRINPEVAFRAETLAGPNVPGVRQEAGTVHVHPNGRFLYGVNRAGTTIEIAGKRVLKGGENNIVVYSINPKTGEPKPIQHVETRAIHARTFHVDPSGRLLVAQHNLPVNVKEGNAIRTLPAGLSVFRIGDDGRLTLMRKYNIEVGDKTMFLMGMVSL
jgi:6-phosphogluconolactonase (cycloisomerase 2 family)